MRHRGGFVSTLVNRKVNKNSVIDNLQAAWKLFCHMQATKDLIEEVEEQLDALEGVLEFSQIQIDECPIK